MNCITQVVALVLDGLSANVSMCKLLGCQMKLPNPRPSFHVNDKEIFVILDACHMLKLLRNTFESSKKLLSAKGLFFLEIVK